MEMREKDQLKALFNQMPKEDLPPSFREKMMQKVLLEAVRIKKRNERIGFLLVVLASLFMVILAGLSFWHLDLPKAGLHIPELTTLPFYTYIGALVLLLLYADYKFRQLYRRKHQGE
jgi:hypothetical protein